MKTHKAYTYCKEKAKFVIASLTHLLQRTDEILLNAHRTEDSSYSFYESEVLHLERKNA